MWLVAIVLDTAALNSIAVIPNQAAVAHNDD